MSLFLKVFLTNAAVLIAAGVVLASTPGQVEWPQTLREGATLLIGAAIMLVLTLVLLRRQMAPLGRLREAISTVDPLADQGRIPVYGDDAEVVELTRTFNEMLDRLEAERRQSVRQALAAQEGERARIARELHDEVGQSLTAVLLQLERAGRQVPPVAQEALTEAREATRSSLEEVRGIARRLRPEALDDLGLASALTALADGVSARTGLRVGRRLERNLPDLSDESELVIYRVAQEALTNALRHAGASEVVLSLACRDGGVSLVVSDDGHGLNGAAPGTGLQGMRERALLVGARLTVEDRPGGGTEVRLDLDPAGQAA